MLFQTRQYLYTPDEVTLINQSYTKCANIIRKQTTILKQCINRIPLIPNSIMEDLISSFDSIRGIPMDEKALAKAKQLKWLVVIKQHHNLQIRIDEDYFTYLLFSSGKPIDFYSRAIEIVKKIKIPPYDKPIVDCISQNYPDFYNQFVRPDQPIIQFAEDKHIFQKVKQIIDCKSTILSDQQFNELIAQINTLTMEYYYPLIEQAVQQILKQLDLTWQERSNNEQHNYQFSRFNKFMEVRNQEKVKSSILIKKLQYVVYNLSSFDPSKLKDSINYYKYEKTHLLIMKFRDNHRMYVINGFQHYKQIQQWIEYAKQNNYIISYIRIAPQFIVKEEGGIYQLAKLICNQQRNAPIKECLYLQQYQELQKQLNEKERRQIAVASFIKQKQEEFKLPVNTTMDIFITMQFAQCVLQFRQLKQRIPIQSYAWLMSGEQNWTNGVIIQRDNTQLIHSFLYKTDSQSIVCFGADQLNDMQLIYTKVSDIDVKVGQLYITYILEQLKNIELVKPFLEIRQQYMVQILQNLHPVG